MGPLSQLDRTQKLLGGLDIAQTIGLEIGALNCPMLRPPEARIRYVDHTDQATLREKYANEAGVRPEDIVPVDAVWGDHTLAECFPGEQFDYVIASHVMEHVPDAVGWMAEIASVLRPGGQLIMALPDRRYSFDLERRDTSLADWVDNHLRGVRRPTPGQVFDFNANSIDWDHMRAWFSPAPARHRHYVGRDYALEQARLAQHGAYVDVHCSVFTARALLELLDGLLELGLLAYRLDRFYVAPVGSGEMSLILRREPDGADPEAARATIRAMLESGVDTEGLELDTLVEPVPTLGVVEDPRVAQLEHALAAMQASTSWKITAPLRAAMRRLRPA
jgi:SAM-dependent methyltransferase